MDGQVRNIYVNSALIDAKIAALMAMKATMKIARLAPPVSTLLHQDQAISSAPLKEQLPQVTRSFGSYSTSQNTLSRLQEQWEVITHRHDQIPAGTRLSIEEFTFTDLIMRISIFQVLYFITLFQFMLGYILCGLEQIESYLVKTETREATVRDIISSTI